MGVHKATCVAHVGSGGWMTELNSSLLSLVLNVLVRLVFTQFLFLRAQYSRSGGISAAPIPVMWEVSPCADVRT